MKSPRLQILERMALAFALIAGLLMGAAAPVSKPFALSPDFR